LVKGGLPALEVTLRTPAALDVIRAMSEVPGGVVGAGTLLTPADVRAAKAAGARFGVSPGATDRLIAACEDEGLPLLPGAATATEVMILLEKGFTVQKFFPAETSGGAPALKALGAPIPQVSFCPTGGVSLKNFRKDILVTLMNLQGVPVRTYKVYRCWPSEFTAFPDLDASASAVAIQSLKLEIQAIQVYHPEARVAAALESVAGLGHYLIDWFMERITTEQILLCHERAHGEVVNAAVQFKGDASTLRGRLMQDMSVILQKINRVQTIRDTTFVPLVYWMADIAVVLLFGGLVMARSENILESVFFLGVISFILILLLRLIDDIDNPFGLSDLDSAEDVSIKLLEHAVDRL
jgi:hypothetical protein